MPHTSRNPSYADLVIASNPVAYWRLGERSGTVARDSMGISHGTYTNSPTLGVAGGLAGDGDTGITLDGISPYVSVAHTSALNLGNLFSIMVLVKRNYVGNGFLALMGKDYNQPQPAFNNDKLNLDDAGVGSVVSETGTTTDTNWHHVVFTYTGTVAKIYKDAVDVSGATTVRTFVDNSLSLSIGAFQNFNLFNGSLDELALYKRILTAAEIMAFHTTRLGR